jgi:hypothetical protein
MQMIYKIAMSGMTICSQYCDMNEMPGVKPISRVYIATVEADSIGAAFGAAGEAFSELDWTDLFIEDDTGKVWAQNPGEEIFEVTDL